MVGQHSVMKTFLPEETYFREHPEWYGMIMGESNNPFKWS